MCFSGKKKDNVHVYPCKPQFYYIKVGFKGVKLYRHVFVMFHIFSDIMARKCILVPLSVCFITSSLPLAELQVK